MVPVIESSPTCLKTEVLPDFEGQYELSTQEQQGLAFLHEHPDINIHLYFSAHGAASDYGSKKQFEQPIADADIYAFENYGSTGSYQRRAEFISKHRGFLGQLAIIFTSETSSDELRQLNAIRKSKAIPIETDTDIDHPLSDNSLSIDLLNEWNFAGRSLSSAELKDAIRKFADQQRKREWVALAALGNKIANLSAHDPDIEQKLNRGTLKIFMTFGEAHTGLFHNLQRLGLKPTRSFPHKPVIFNNLETAIRKGILTK